MEVHLEDITFWVIQNGEVTVHKKKNDYYGSGTQTNTVVFLETLIQLACEEIDIRSTECEDRSLDNVREQRLTEATSEEIKPSSLQLQRGALNALYHIVICPIADMLQCKEIVFVPNGPLCLAPFPALLDSNKNYLCESFRIRVILSLSSLAMIEDCPADYHNNCGALLIGDPWVQDVVYHGRNLQQLPYAREEVEMIGRILNTEPLTGIRATKRRSAEAAFYGCFSAHCSTWTNGNWRNCLGSESDTGIPGTCRRRLPLNDEGSFER